MFNGLYFVSAISRCFNNGYKVGNIFKYLKYKIFTINAYDISSSLVTPPLVCEGSLVLEVPAGDSFSGF